MKKNRYIYFISFCLVAFCLFVFAYSKYTSQKEIQSNLIYEVESDRIVKWGSRTINIPQGADFAFDQISQTGWFHITKKDYSVFICINKNGEEEKSILVKYNEPSVSIREVLFFVSDSVALIEGKYNNMFYLIDLKTRNYRTVSSAAFHGLQICSFYRDMIFFYDSGNNSITKFNYNKNMVERVEPNLIGYGYMPLKESFVGINEKGKISILNYNTLEQTELNIRGLKNEKNGFVNDRYYLTADYLYFSKFDYGYYIKYLPIFILMSFCTIASPSAPHSWYRYSFESHRIDKISSEDKFIKILGTIE